MPRFLTGAAVPFFLGFSTLGADGSGLLIMAAEVDEPGASWSNRAAEAVFFARPPLLIFSEMDMEAILSTEGVTSRELVDCSVLIMGFLGAGLGVDILEEEAVDP